MSNKMITLFSVAGGMHKNPLDSLNSVKDISRTSIPSSL
jgi:hypothetical protein